MPIRVAATVLAEPLTRHRAAPVAAVGRAAMGAPPLLLLPLLALLKIRQLAAMLACIESTRAAQQLQGRGVGAGSAGEGSDLCSCCVCWLLLAGRWAGSQAGRQPHKKWRVPRVLANQGSMACHSTPYDALPQTVMQTGSRTLFGATQCSPSAQAQDSKPCIRPANQPAHLLLRAAAPPIGVGGA